MLRGVAQPLSIGLNLLFLTRDAGGVGTYVRGLVPALLHAEPGLRVTALASRDVPPEDVASPWGQEVQWVRAPVGAEGAWGAAALRLGSQWIGLPALSALRRVDVIHGLANIAPLVAPGAATVVTLHDLIWLRREASMGPRDTLAMRLTALPSVRMADRVLAVSAAARDDLVDTLGLDPDRVDVVPHGVGSEPLAHPVTETSMREALDLGNQPVVLCLAQKREHKNLAALIRALPALGDTRAVVVLPGAPNAYEEELRRLADQLGVTDRVRFPPWLDESQIEGLFRMAACLALPSFEEGFGLPVLEAMSRGVPVVCSDIPPLREVAGDAALLFDPHDAAALADRLRSVLTDTRQAAVLRETGRRRAARFTWDRAAQQTLASYRRAIDGRRLVSYDRRAAPSRSK